LFEFQMLNTLNLFAFLKRKKFHLKTFFTARTRGALYSCASCLFQNFCMNPILVFLLCLSLPAASQITLQGFTHQVVEWSYESDRAYDDPFMQVELEAEITFPDGQKRIVPAYWSGDRYWSFRFSSGQTGVHRFLTRCSDAANSGLHQKKGSIRLSRYEGDNPLYRHGPLKVSADRRHFEFANGTPFFWLADSWWFGMSSRFAWPEDFQYLTADRKNKGFSVIQFAIAFSCDIAPFDPRDANEAGFGWRKGFGTINPAYFDLTDQRVACLVRNGLLPNIVGAWGYYLPEMGVGKMKKHWRYLIARYGAYPVVWTLAGEVTLPWYLAPDQSALREWQREHWSEVGRYVRSTDPYNRLMTVHPGGQGVAQPLVDMNTVDFTMAMPGHSGFHTVSRSVTQLRQLREAYPDKPFMHGEVSFEGMHGSSKEDVQRIFFWSSLLSGSAGHCYGADAIWQFNTPEAPFGPSPLGQIWGNTPWQTACQWPGATQVGIGKRILESVPWHTLQPNQQAITPAANESDPFAPYCATTPDDSLRVLYFPRAIPPWGKGFLVKNLIAGRTYEAVFIDPVSGKPEKPMTCMPTADGSWKVPFAPILQDWVLMIYRK
jgi:Protein of unknown function (DUF4038)/Domain of unknown function (DUF5060)